MSILLNKSYQVKLLTRKEESKEIVTKQLESNWEGGVKMAKNMFVPGLDGMYYNVVNMTTGRHVTTPTMTMAVARQSSSSSSMGSIDLIARSNIEGSLFLDACRHRGDQAMCDEVQGVS